MRLLLLETFASVAAVVVVVDIFEFTGAGNFVAYASVRANRYCCCNGGAYC